MTKQLSVTLLSILLVLIVLFGVFTFLPDNISYGDYGVFHAPANLIQKGPDIGPSVTATYSVDTTDLEEGVLENVDNIVTTRLNKMFNYYGLPVVLEGNKLSVTVPQTANEEKTDAKTIIETVVAEGKIEFLPSQEYSESNVVLSNYGETKYFSNVSTSNYVNGANKYYIVNVSLTSEGKELASEKFTASTTSWGAYCAVDGIVTYGAVYSNDTLQIYTSSKEQAVALATYINYGSLQTTLTETGYENVDSSIPSASLIFGIATLVLIVAVALALLIKYGVNGVAGILSILISALVFTIFSGLVYFSVFNLYAWIGVVLGLALISSLTFYSLGKVKYYQLAGNGNKYARKTGFNSSLIRTLIVNLCVLVVGIILWVIPTGVTLGLGNSLVYSAVLSMIFTLGLNRAFVSMLAPLSK